MIETVTADTLAGVLERRKGYLVNVWPGVYAKAHILGSLHGACRATLGATPTYPKYFATTLEEAKREAREHYREKVCETCGNCERVKRSR